MLQDEFIPIPHKILTIGRSPKESVIAIPKAIFIIHSFRFTQGTTLNEKVLCSLF